MSNHFGQWLKRTRREMKWTGEKLSEAVGMSQGYVSMLERGERDASDDMALKIADAMGVSRADSLAAWFADKAEDAGVSVEEIQIRYEKDPRWKRIRERYNNSNESGKSRMDRLTEAAMDDVEKEARKGVIGGNPDMAGREEVTEPEPPAD